MNKVLVILLLMGLKFYSQIPPFFNTRFGGNDDDVGNCIIQALNGGYIVVGQTNSFGASQTDIYLSRTNNLAQPIWQKSIGGVASDIGKSVIELPDSSIVIAGYTNSFGGGGYDAYIVRTDKNGNLLWQKTFGGADWDFAYSINKTADGNIIVCGATYSYGRGDKDAFILKIDYSGNFLWNKIYGGTLEDDLKEIISTSDGGFIATGTTKSYGDSLGDIWITKFDASGDSTWFKTYGGIKKDVGNSIVQNASGDYFVAGGSENTGSGKEDALAFKFNGSGTFLSIVAPVKLSNSDEEAYSIKNSFSVVGGIVFCYTTTELLGFGKDSKTLLFDASGIYVNGGRVGSASDDEVFSVANCKDRGYIVAGYTTGFNADRKDIFVVKFDSLMNGPGAFMVGVKENASDDNLRLKIYPNPFIDNLSFEISKREMIDKVEIINLVGNVIFEQNGIKSDKVEIGNIELTSGIYVVKVTSANNIYFSKIFCKK